MQIDGRCQPCRVRGARGVLHRAVLCCAVDCGREQLLNHTSQQQCTPSLRRVPTANGQSVAAAVVALSLWMLPKLILRDRAMVLTASRHTAAVAYLTGRQLVSSICWRLFRFGSLWPTLRHKRRTDTVGNMQTGRGPFAVLFCFGRAFITQ